MTSNSKQSEGHEEYGFSDVDRSVQLGQAIDSQALKAEEVHDKALPHSEYPAAQRAKGASRLTLSAGYIPIAAKSPSSSRLVEDASFEEVGVEPIAADIAQAPDAGAFEMLERDLAELGSFLGAPDMDSALASTIAEPVAPPDSSLAALEPDSAAGDAIDPIISIQPISHSSREETSIMNAQAQRQQEQAHSDAAIARVAVESAVTAYQSSAMETDGVLHDVQSTLDSLAGMAHGLSQQKLEIVKLREALEERRLATVERERQLAEREDRLSQQEQRLQDEKQGIERVAEQNAAVLAERSSALQALAETVDSRDRATAKRADVLNQEQQSIERQLNQMRSRAQELDDREAGLQRQSSELADRFKQLLDAKERFGAIVKGFNETVRFNTTYSAISKSVGTGEEV
jgi:hypothetical protein